MVKSVSSIKSAKAANKEISRLKKRIKAVEMRKLKLAGKGKKKAKKKKAKKRAKRPAKKRAKKKKR